MEQLAVSLKPATNSDKPVLTRLLYDYQRELLPYSGHTEEEITSYKYLVNYFTDADRAAFLVMVRGEVGGFVFVNAHTLIEPDAHSIAEFYIIPAFRHSGVGEQVATMAFAKFPGRWEVAQIGTNQPAVNFWRKVIGNVTNGQYKETILNTDTWHGPVQAFDVT